MGLQVFFRVVGQSWYQLQSNVYIPVYIYLFFLCSKHVLLYPLLRWIVTDCAQYHVRKLDGDER